MGLDSVELLMATEDEFGIVIAYADAAKLRTPRMVADYVVSRLGNGAAKRSCQSQAGFYRIRAVLVEQFGASRKDVRLDSPIRQFLNGDIKAQWHQLKCAVNATQLPGLQCHKYIVNLMVVGVPLLSLLPLFLMAPAWVGVIAFFLLLIAATIATDKMANLVPPTLTTISAIVPYVGIANHEEWGHEYVLQRTIQITSLQLGIPIDQIHPDDDFVGNLGMD